MTGSIDDWFARYGEGEPEPASKPDAKSAAKPDPMRAAQAAMRAPLPKRFYREVSTGAGEGGVVLLLDGRGARTPARNPFALPSQALAEAVAEEWREQEEVIDPARMPLTKLANSAIDGVALRRQEVVDDLVRYAGSDLVCYRAGEPARLVREQGASWDPILAFAREALGARFVLSEGVTHVRQADAALDAIRRALADEPPFRLAALHVMTTLTGSVLLALAHARGALDAEAAWAAAHVDEHFQESVWGRDDEAMARRDARRGEFLAASRFYGLAG